MKYLKYMVIGTLLVSGMFAKELPEDQAWNNFRFAPKLAGDAPAYSLINIGNFGYWQKYDAYSAHTPSGNSGGIYPRGTAANIYLDGVLVGGYTGGGNEVYSQSFIDLYGQDPDGDGVTDYEEMYRAINIDNDESYRTQVGQNLISAPRQVFLGFSVDF